MKLPTTFFVLFLGSINLSIASEPLDLNDFALRYFEAKTATQDPNATPEVLEQYLALLADDVGYEHKPYKSLGELTKDGKSRMREGMTYYLGGNESYSATLVSIAVGHHAIAIQYQVDWAGKIGGQGPSLKKNYVVMEVLEMVDGEVSIIRQFSG